MNRESFAKKKLPERPDLVLRLGFAGNRNLPDDPDNLLPRAINWVLDGISRQLAILAPGVLDPPTPATSPEHVLKFYSQEFPVLRIVTGLAEGADSLIGKEVIRRRNSSGTEFSATRVRQSAILPCQPEAYRESRDLNLYSHSYDELLEDCDHIIVFDGPSTLYPRGNTKEGRQLETPIDKERRGHAYRAQSELILRNSDLLLAVADRSVPGLAGGTLETIRDAQHFKLPVVLIDLITSTNPAFDRQAVNDNTAKIPERLLRQARISLVEPGEPFKGAMLPDECFLVGESSQRASEQAREEKVSIELQRWITAITAGPNLSLPDESHKTPGKHSHLDFLSDFFDREDVPPKKEAWSDFASREALWKNFLIHCGKITRLGDYIRREFRALRDGTHHVFPPPSFRESPGDAIPAGAPERRHLEEIEKFRGRATELNYHFTGLYRGAFILNYGLAVFAVFIAALSLVLIGEEKSLPQVVGDIFSSTADPGASCHVG
ncbi:MAG: hypothetical protein KDM91_20765, partial [Verrucomicrobiae bacterium]|nr:hypothetical protein [Verrucomicrobiae bacterium]